MTRVPPDNSIAAQFLAVTDQRGDCTTHTLELLGDAVRTATQLRGQVAAWMLAAGEDDQGPPPAALQALARHGCHGVDRLCHPRFARWSSEAVAAALAASTAGSCRVIFLPGTARGEEVSALLAARLETEWFADVLTVSVTRTGVLEITAVEPGGKLSRTLRRPAHRPVVVSIRTGVAEARPVGKPREPVVRDVQVDLSDVPELTAVRAFLPADPATIDIRLARRVVAGGRGTAGQVGMQLLAALAEALGASLAASRMAVDLGWAPPARQVGQTGKTVCPDLYVACGISGASHHVAGMRDSKHIVAINSDPEAAIHDVAHLNLVGDLHSIVPAICAALARRSLPDEVQDE